MVGMNETPLETNDDVARSGRFPKWLKYGVFALIAVVLVGYGLIFLYAKVLNDSPDELTTDDLAAALDVADTTAPAGDEPSVSEAATTDAPTTDAPAADVTDDDTVAATTAPTETASTASPSGDSPRWEVTDASELGYRVKEILFGVDAEGVGRTNQITGTLTIDAATVTSASFEVDVASITSDESRRDNQFRGRIMSTDEFPTATFTLTRPIELGVEAEEGAAVSTTATGDLTLRGVTNTVTFDVTAELADGRIGVLGNIPVVFADYGIDNPSAGGITTEDNGLLEFVLIFEMS